MWFRSVTVAANRNKAGAGLQRERRLHDVVFSTGVCGARNRRHRRVRFVRRRRLGRVLQREQLSRATVRLVSGGRSECHVGRRHHRKHRRLRPTNRAVARLGHLDLLYGLRCIRRFGRRQLRDRRHRHSGAAVAGQCNRSDVAHAAGCLDDRRSEHRRSVRHECPIWLGRRYRRRRRDVGCRTGDGGDVGRRLKRVQGQSGRGRVPRKRKRCVLAAG